MHIIRYFVSNKFNGIYLCFIWFLLSLSNTLTGQEVPGLTFGGLQDETGISLCKDGSGGYILVGTTRSFGSGSNDVYIVKINENLSEEWTRTIGTAHQEFARSIFPTTDGYLISGKSFDPKDGPRGTLLIKIDKSGNLIFERTYGLEFRDIGHSVLETSDQDIVVLGYTRKLKPYGTVRIFKTDNNGDKLWDYDYGFDRDEYAFEIIEDINGDYVFVGTRDGFFDDVHANYKNHDADLWISKIKSDGTETFSKTYGSTGHDFGNSIEEVIDGYLVLGSTQSYGNGSFDMSLMKLGFDGDSLWQKTFGEEDFDYGLSLSVNSSGEIFMLGTSGSFSDDGTTEMLLYKTDNDGNEIWRLTLGGDKNEWGNSVVNTDDGGCVVLGTSDSYGAGMNDVFITKISSDGEIESYSSNIEKKITKNIIAPNPTRNYARVNLPSQTSDLYMLKIYTLNGIEVKNKEIGNSSRQIQTSSLSSGTYIYTLTNTENDTMVSGKLIIY